MGVAASTLWASLFGSRQLKLCILGLDNAGKTTLCYQMSMGQAVATAPTVGSNTELFTYRNVSAAAEHRQQRTSARGAAEQRQESTRRALPAEQAKRSARGLRRGEERQ
jgi:GTPase SAR1 family protein